MKLYLPSFTVIITSNWQVCMSWTEKYMLVCIHDVLPLCLFKLSLTYLCIIPLNSLKTGICSGNVECVKPILVIAFSVFHNEIPRGKWMLEDLLFDVNNGSDYGLVLSGTSPLSEPLLTQINNTKWCHHGTKGLSIVPILNTRLLLFPLANELIICISCFCFEWGMSPQPLPGLLHGWKFSQAFKWNLSNL